MNREIYKQQLIEKIMEQITKKEQELQHRKRRLEENILAGACIKSILELELELDWLLTLHQLRASPKLATIAVVSPALLYLTLSHLRGRLNPN